MNVPAHGEGSWTCQYPAHTTGNATYGLTMPGSGQGWRNTFAAGVRRRPRGAETDETRDDGARFGERQVSGLWETLRCARALGRFVADRTFSCRGEGLVWDGPHPWAARWPWAGVTTVFGLVSNSPELPGCGAETGRKGGFPRESGYQTPWWLRTRPNRLERLWREGLSRVGLSRVAARLCTGARAWTHMADRTVGKAASGPACLLGSPKPNVCRLGPFVCQWLALWPVGKSPDRYRGGNKRAVRVQATPQRALLRRGERSGQARMSAALAGLGVW
jgi:hypothetical protein